MLLSKKRKNEELVSRAKVLVEQANEYLADNYVDPAIKEKQLEEQRAAEQKAKEQAAKKGKKEADSPEEPRVQYSLKSQDSDYARNLRLDLYDSSKILSSLKGFSNPPTRILETIEKNTNLSFVDKMLEYIDKKHWRDSKVYKAAQIDRRLYSKIVSDRSYKPAKDTCIAICFALNLPLNEANDMLSRAGYTLSHSSKRDVIIECLFHEKVYEIDAINMVLFDLGQKTLGR